MATLNDFPELKAVFDKLTDEQNLIKVKSQSLWDRYNKLQAIIDPHKDEMRTLQQEIQSIERPRMGEIANQLSAIARAVGGRATSDRIIEEVLEKDKE